MRISSATARFYHAGPPHEGATLHPVPLFSRKPRTRSELVAAADRARARGRVKKAVAGYRQALASDPEDPAVNVKLGPLLARLGDEAGGAACFRTASRRHLAQGFTDRAAGVNAAAAATFPLDAGFRLELARLNLVRGRRADAVAALVDGGRALAGARRGAAALPLLRQALELEPWHAAAILVLAPLLARAGEADEARRLLDGLDGRLAGRARRRARWVALRLWPSPRTLWRWLFPGSG
jgi:thioredoxin-like negative regulator of GroEL